MVVKLSGSDELSHKSTAELKHQILELIEGRDIEPLSKKALFYQNELSPLFEELSQRNPFPTPEEQEAVVMGVWTPAWSTIPFQDIFPGRIHDQSYQIFHSDGYYANIARYAPGSKLSFLKELSKRLLVYDFMVVQKFNVQKGQWHIQNVGIEQAFRIGGFPLDIDKAESWFTTVVQSKLQKNDSLNAPDLSNLDQSVVKKVEKTFLAIPQLEHLYIDHDFRLIKTQREAKQRPSYTIAVRPLLTVSHEA